MSTMMSTTAPYIIKTRRSLRALDRDYRRTNRRILWTVVVLLTGVAFTLGTMIAGNTVLA